MVSGFLKCKTSTVEVLLKFNATLMEQSLMIWTAIWSMNCKVRTSVNLFQSFLSVQAADCIYYWNFICNISFVTYDMQAKT